MPILDQPGSQPAEQPLDERPEITASALAQTALRTIERALRDPESAVMREVLRNPESLQMLTEIARGAA